MRAYVWVPGRMSVCMLVHVALFIRHATLMRHIVTSFVAPLAPPYVSTLSHKRSDFRTKLLNIKRVFDFLYNICLKHFSF